MSSPVFPIVRADGWISEVRVWSRALASEEIGQSLDPPPPSEPIEVHVRNLAGALLTFETNAASSVSELARDYVLEADLGPNKAVTFTLDNRPLEDSSFLGACGVTNGATLHVIVREKPPENTIDTRFDGLTPGELAERRVAEGHGIWPETVAWLQTGAQARPSTPPDQAMHFLSSAVKAGASMTGAARTSYTMGSVASGKSGAGGVAAGLAGVARAGGDAIRRTASRPARSLKDAYRRGSQGAAQHGDLFGGLALAHRGVGEQAGAVEGAGVRVQLDRDPGLHQAQGVQNPFVAQGVELHRRDVGARQPREVLCPSGRRVR